ncbi:hypothetical protein KR054_005119 [Drosophila jambulina]|nr:hypothetical protein KR054_005119 [Drosophila jambulina]
MGLLLFWIFQVVLSAVLEAEAGSHFHRYMVSDYKPQHTLRKQMDYRRHSPRTQMDFKAQHLQRTMGEDHGSLDIRSNKTYGKSKEPQILLNRSRKKVMLHQLLVRILHDNEYKCVGTQITESIVVTAMACFDGIKTDVVTMKTFNNETLTGIRRNQNGSVVLSEDSLLAIIALDMSPQDSVLKDDAAQLCNTKLQDNAPIEMPIWMRKRHSFHSWHSMTLPVHECRYRLKDDHGEIVKDTMICIRNERYTKDCQKAIGNPLIHNNMICGVNVAGLNCPNFTGLAMYSTIYDKELAMNGIQLIEKLDIEQTIL